jgi:chromosome segregation ATPase
MEPPSLVSTRTEQAQSIASMSNQLTDLEREIVELKAQQAKMLFENSERDKHLEEAQELARRNVNLIKDLKSAQVQMGQDNGNLAAQLKASQEQMATLAAQLDASQIQMAKIAAQTKASQDQIPRIAEQRQRAKPLVAASQLASGPANKPTPKPRPQHPKPQTQNPAQAPIR